MSCILKINNIYEQLTEVDKKLADYIKENKEVISKQSVAKLAEKAGVSTASIVRFSRKVGYEGFGDLKIELAKDLMVEDKEYTYIDSSNGSSVENIITNISNKNIETIKQAVTLNDASVISDTVEKIMSAKNVYVFGIGGSSLVALDLQLKLLRINKTTFTSQDSHTQLMVSSNIGKDDIAIGISYSGSTKEIVKSIENAKKNGATCVSLTKYGENNLSKLCDLNLFVPSIEKKLREGAISSRISMLTIIDIIYIAMIHEDIDKAQDRLKETRATIDFISTH